MQPFIIAASKPPCSAHPALPARGHCTLQSLWVWTLQTSEDPVNSWSQASWRVDCTLCHVSLHTLNPTAFRAHWWDPTVSQQWSLVPFHRGAQGLSLLVQPCWCSQISLSDTDRMKASSNVSLPAQADHDISSPVLNQTDYNKWFQAVCPSIVTWYSMVSWYEYAFPFYSQYILVWIQKMYIFCFNNKERPREVGLIFGDLYLIFLWQGTKDVCIH